MDFHDFLRKRLEQYNIETQEVLKSENHFKKNACKRK